MPATVDFLVGLRALCDDYNAVFICDEVQCGLGRTGKLFGHEVYSIEPDIVTLAKPLAGGLPIGAVLTKDKIANAVTPGAHGTTFGGNPIVCAAANVVMKRLLEPGFLLVHTSIYIISYIYHIYRYSHVMWCIKVFRITGKDLMIESRSLYMILYTICVYTKTFVHASKFKNWDACWPLV